VIRSNGGGSNSILVRGGLEIVEHRTRRLRSWPERRQLQAVRLGGASRGAGSTPALAGPLWAGNLHATVHDDGAARHEVFVAGERMLSWAAGAPIVLGGDFNVRGLALGGYELAAVYDVDHLFVRGLTVVGEAEVLDRGRLSDHAPVVVTLQPR
jgi:endonuclease/exonuclease/phosphatase family metal-dependent hydrolase